MYPCIYLSQISIYPSINLSSRANRCHLPYGHHSNKSWGAVAHYNKKGSHLQLLPRRSRWTTQLTGFANTLSYKLCQNKLLLNQGTTVYTLWHSCLMVRLPWLNRSWETAVEQIMCQNSVLAVPPIPVGDLRWPMHSSDPVPPCYKTVTMILKPLF